MGLPPGSGPFDPNSGGDDSFLSALGQILTDMFIFIENQVIAIFSVLKDWIILIEQWAYTLFIKLGKFLLHIWQNYVKAAITWLYHEAQKVRAWLKRIVSPIIKRLEKIKQWYDQHILKQQLRMLQMIQTLRRILGILRLFHIKWASTLDNALADLQTRIEQSIAIVRGVLNQIINTLALLLEPTLLITRNVLGGTLLSNLGALRRIFGYNYHGPLTAKETTYLNQNVGRYQESTAGGHISTLAATGLTDYDKSELSDFRTALSNVTGQPSVL